MQGGASAESENTFLRFHPTLAPALWQKLAKEEQAELTGRLLAGVLPAFQ